MGYWVSVSGNMELRNITDGDARRIIESVIDPHMYDTAIDIEANDSGDVLIDLWAYIKWHDGIDDMLADLSPYTVEGEIECSGEDGEFWKYEFDDAAWKEYDGVKDYMFGYAIEPKGETDAP